MNPTEKSGAAENTGCRSPDLASMSDEELLQHAHLRFEAQDRRHRARIAHRKILCGARRQRHYHQTDLLSRRRMVLPRRLRHHRHSVLSRPSAPKEARRKNDDGGRGRHGSLVYAAFAPRDGPRPQSRLFAGKRQTLAKTIRTDFARILRKLSRPALQPALRAPSRRLLCPEPSRKKISPRLSRSGSRPISIGDNQYKGWKALRKTRVRRRADAASSPANRRWCFHKAKISDASRLRSRLEAHYKRRRRHLRSGISRLFRRRSKKAFRRGSRVAERRARRGVFAAIEQIDSQRRFDLDRRTEVYDQPSCCAR